MKVVRPPEAIPEIGTVLNPAVHYDGEDVFLCYEASERAGLGNVVLRFCDVIGFRKTPVNVDALDDLRYPAKPWAFNELIGGAETAAWEVLNPRFWHISFNDVSVEILFQGISIVHRDSKERLPHETLIEFLGQMKPDRH